MCWMQDDFAVSQFDLETLGIWARYGLSLGVDLEEEEHLMQLGNQTAENTLKIEKIVKTENDESALREWEDCFDKSPVMSGV